ncbi:MAG: ABC transporter permease [Nitrososphaerales archaeon]
MINALRDIHTVLWADLRVLRRHWLRTIATSLINPILYLLAFGYGLGKGITFGGYSYLDFVVPGIIALTTMTGSFNGAGSKLHVDRLFYKCFDEILMAPVSIFSIIIGKALAGVIRGIIGATALLLAGLVISPKIAASPMFLLFLLVLVISCFVFAFLGVLIAFVAKSHQDMNTFSNLILLPMTFLSGTFFALEGLPEILRIALYILPLTHSSLCLRAAALNQPFPWYSLIALIGFGVAFFLGCILILKKASV